MAADNFLWFPQAAKGGNLKGNASKPLGESHDAWFADKNAMELKSFSFGVSQAETTGSASTGAGAGKAKFDEFTVEKAVDLASVPLYVACTAGAHFPVVMLACRKAGGSSLLYLEYVFCQVFVTGINWSGGGGEEAPNESIKFKFGAMGIQYAQQKPDGTKGTVLQGMWDVISNQSDLTIPNSGVTGQFDSDLYMGSKT